MKNSLRRFALASLLPLGLASLASAEVHTLTFCCEGSQEVPPVTSTGYAFMTVMVDDVANTVVLNGVILNLTEPATAGHIHGPAGVGQNGGVLIPLTLATSTTGPVSASVTTTAANINHILSGNTYVNIHTSFAPGGEVRGQMVNGIGSSFCATSPNSAGPGAHITAGGCRVVTERTVSLQATGMPPGVSGLFYFGPVQVQTPFGDGLRCVGGLTRRIQPPVAADGAGTAERSLDFAAPYAAGLTAGTTQNFQIWYRDGMAAMSGFNLSDGVSVDFQ